MLLTSALNGQVNYFVNEADLVVKGIITHTESKWNENRTQIITENTIEVETLFKGYIESQKLNLITNGGFHDEVLQYTPHALSFHQGQKGYFFLKRSGAVCRLVNPSASYADIGYQINPKVSFGRTFETEKNFEQRILDASTFPEWEISKYLSLNSEISFKDRDTCEIYPLYKNAHTIDFTFDNVKFNPEFTHVEFDVMAQVNTPGLKFGKGELFIRYSLEFGSNVANNLGVEISKGKIIEQEIYSLNYKDTTSQSLSVEIDAAYGSNALYTFGSSPESLFHVKLKIKISLR